jgi:hypothetical protein
MNIDHNDSRAKGDVFVDFCDGEETIISVLSLKKCKLDHNPLRKCTKPLTKVFKSVLKKSHILKRGTIRPNLNMTNKLNQIFCGTLVTNA